MAAGDIFAAAMIPSMTKATSGVATAASGFAVTSQVGRLLSVVGLIAVRLELTYSGANVVPSGTANIADTLACTLAAAYRPDEPHNAVFGTSLGTGEVQIGTDGNCILRSYDATLNSGTIIRFNLTCLKG